MFCKLISSPNFYTQLYLLIILLFFFVIFYSRAACTSFRVLITINLKNNHNNNVQFCDHFEFDMEGQDDILGYSILIIIA